MTLTYNNNSYKKTMKKTYLIIAATALVALSACTKNEVRPASSDPQEITFQTVVGPQTKALSSTQSSFVGDKFKSYAWFLPQGNTWAANYADAKRYISDAEISKNSEGKWKAANAYYWPKQGSLTFFSWTKLGTDNKANFENAAVDCSNNNGIVITNYSVVTNKNQDLMVADYAADKTENKTTYQTDGVPTLFRHKLTKVGVQLAINKPYLADANATTRSIGDKVFKVKSVSFNNIASEGIYTQGHDGSTDSWAASTTTGPTAVFNGEQALNTTLASVKDADAQFIFLPQDFTASADSKENSKNETVANLKIVYTIDTYYTATDYSTEEVTIVRSLENPTAAAGSQKWEKNKDIVYKITIGLDEILWDPAVEDWTSETYDISL